MDQWLKCGSLNCKTGGNLNAYNIVENSISADNVPSHKKSQKYCPSYLQMGLSILNKNGIALGEC